MTSFFLMDRIASSDNPQYQGFPFVDVLFDGTVTTVRIAVAGYSKSDLKVTQLKDKLCVHGSRKTNDDPSLYRQRNIKSSDFVREFKLNRGAYVDTVSLENGILEINLKHETPEEDIPTEFVIHEE